jgi:hypothetical protein
MSRALRQALEDAEHRLPTVKNELASPDPSVEAKHAALLAEVEPLRASVQDVLRERDAARTKAQESERALAELVTERRARFSRSSVGPWLLIAPLTLVLAALVVWTFVAMWPFSSIGALVVAGLVGLSLGFYLGLRVLER